MQTKIAVIGAGVAGLTAASALAEAGVMPIVFDKSRGIGGRLATRRTAFGDFDHGAPAVAPDTSAFGELLDQLAAAGSAKRWASNGSVGLPGMSGLLAPLAANLEVRTEIEVRTITREDNLWILEEDQGDFGPYARVVLAIPAPQVVRLVPDLAGDLASVVMAQCLTAMFAFEEPLELDDVVRPADSPISLALRNGAKPGRTGETWVVHGNAAFNEAHLERDKPEIAAELLTAFANLAGAPLSAPLYQAGHRWRFARTAQPLGRPYLSAAGGIFAGGDWCLGPNAADAHASGSALAEAVLASL